jgi:DNA-binding XRE family transcriptional regulator
MNKTTLKQLIDENGIKQTWLAKKVGITPPALNLIANGKTLPTLRTAQKIAHILHTTVDELWPLEDNSLPSSSKRV